MGCMLVVCVALTSCARPDEVAPGSGETSVASASGEGFEPVTDVWTEARVADVGGRYVWYDPGEEDDDPPVAGERAAAIFGVPNSDDTAVTLICWTNDNITLGSAWLYNGRAGASMEMRLRAGDAIETVNTTLDGGTEMDPSPFASLGIANRGFIEAMASAETLTVIGREAGASEWAGFRVGLNEEAFRRFVSSC